MTFKNRVSLSLKVNNQLFAIEGRIAVKPLFSMVVRKAKQIDSMAGVIA